MGKDWEIACPKCGGHKLNTYRHMFAKMWCMECDFVLRDEGSAVMNTYEGDKVENHDKFKPCTKLRAYQVETQCPYCNAWNGRWKINPRGKVDECNSCCKEYRINPDADVELVI